MGLKLSVEVIDQSAIHYTVRRRFESFASARHDALHIIVLARIIVVVEVFGFVFCVAVFFLFDEGAKGFGFTFIAPVVGGINPNATTAIANG